MLPHTAHYEWLRQRRVGAKHLLIAYSGLSLLTGWVTRLALIDHSVCRSRGPDFCQRHPHPPGEGGFRAGPIKHPTPQDLLKRWAQLEGT